MERIKLAIDKARQAAQQAQPRPVHRLDGTVPAAGLKPSRTQALDPKHLATHRIVAFQRLGPSRLPFDLLRTQVLQKMQANGWTTLAVTSPSMHSGKTMVAINLAMTIAHHPDHRAVLVDFDLRRPSIGARLGIDAGPSLSDVFAGDCDLEQAVVDVGVPKLSVIPTDRPVPGAAEVLGSVRTTQLIERIKTSTPGCITIFDLPPVLAVDDVIAVQPKIDCILLVVANGMSSKREIQEAQRHLGGANVIGYVLNMANAATTTRDYE